MKYTNKCLVSPNVIARLRFLEELQDGGVNAFLEAISNPGEWFYLRVNVLKAKRDELVNRLRSRLPNLTIEEDPKIPEAIKIHVDGPMEIDEQEKKIDIDKFAAESVIIAAPLFSAGFKGTKSSFKKGDLVSMHHRFSTPWDGTQHDMFCGNCSALYHSDTISSIAKTIIARTVEPWFYVPSFQEWNEFKQGMLVDQAFPSMVATRVLDPQPGDQVLDVCCGAGGKSTHIAQLMQDKGSIISIDRSGQKLDQLARRAERMGITCIEPLQVAAEHMKSHLARSSPSKLFVDPPCSALGLRPKLYVDDTISDLDSFVANQIRILRFALDCVDPGTTCVYSTCTVTYEENEGVIAKVIEKDNMKIVDPGIKIGHPGLETDVLSKAESQKLVRFFPHLDGVEGFFIAKLEKQ
nr:RsmB/NOP family class I SAM-dependent RNA methyltransferase [Candidatus Sigynarchaeota archaeon]